MSIFIKTVFFAVLIIAIASAEYAQYTDVVSLKNGSVIKGIIIENVPDSTIKLQTADGRIMVFSYAEIAKMTKEKKIEPAQTQESANTIELYLRISSLLKNPRENGLEIQKLIVKSKERGLLL